MPANTVSTVTGLNAAVFGNTVQLSGTFADPNTGDPHNVIMDWGDDMPQTKSA